MQPDISNHMETNGGLPHETSASSLSGLSGLGTNVEPLQAEPPQCLWSTSNTGSTKFVKVVVEVAFVPTTKESFWRPSYRPPVRRTCQPWPPPRDASWRPDVGSHKDESRAQDRVLKMERLKHTLTIYIYHLDSTINACRNVNQTMYICIIWVCVIFRCRYHVLKHT